MNRKAFKGYHVVISTCRKTKRGCYILSEKYLYQFNVKLSHTLRAGLEEVAHAQGVKASELVRNWIREKIAEYRRRRGRPRKPPAAEEKAA